MDKYSNDSICLPPVWCSAICRNAMNEACVEYCAPKRDCSGFDPKPNLRLADMPRFPNTDDMSREEKFTSVSIYLSKVVDHLQGENVVPVFSSSPRSMRVMNNKKVNANTKISGSRNVVQDENELCETTDKPTKPDREDE